VEEAAAAGIVVIAVPWDRVPEAVQGLSWDRKIVIDTTNDFTPGDLHGLTSSEVVAGLVAGGQRVLFLSGDDAAAKSDVAVLLGGAGFSTIDLGGLSSGGAMQQLGGPLAGVNFIRLPDAD
jgi:8-hydroxy-5-deazaflavin:NADPH oxidoreductase